MTRKRVVSRTSFVDPKLVGSTKPTGPKRVHRDTIESVWSCSSCGTGKIPGGTKVCPNCAHPKDASETYQPPANPAAAPALSARQLAAMGVDSDHSSDQECQYCGGKMKPGTKVCPHCSANLGDVARADRICDFCRHESSEAICPQCGGVTRSKYERAAPRPVHHQVARPWPLAQDIGARSKSVFSSVDIANPLVWGTAIVLFLIAVAAFIFWPRTAEVRVESVSWTAEVRLQEYQYNQHSGWNLPAGADLVSAKNEVHHYDQVPDGTETEWYSESVCVDVYSHTDVTCYDDGSCDRDDVYRESCTSESRSRQVQKYRDVPVYQTHYTYMVWEWVNTPSAVARGDDYEPRWPDDYLIDATHRESGRKMTYKVGLLTPDKKTSFSYSPETLEEYQTFRLRSAWSITHSGGRIKEIQRIER